MCRLEIYTKKEDNINQLNLKKQAWSIISDDEVYKKESFEEMEIMFNNALNRLLKK